MSAALKVFAEKGFTEATNRDIAREAGLSSPALIYHYFPSKLELLRSIAEAHSPHTALTARKEWLMAQPPESALTAIGNAYLQIFERPETRPFARLVLGEALRNEEFADTFAKVGPLRMINLIAEYLEAKMEEGVLRRTDPFHAARGFVGPFISIFLYRTVFGNHPEFPVDHSTLVANAVTNFLEGVATSKS